MPHSSLPLSYAYLRPLPIMAALRDYVAVPSFLINTHRMRPTVWRLLAIGPGLWAVCVTSDPLHLGGPSRSQPISMMPSTGASCELPRNTWRRSQDMPSRHWCENSIGGSSFSRLRGGPPKAMGHLG